jgi:hypothetical protein
MFNRLYFILLGGLILLALVSCAESDNLSGVEETKKILIEPTKQNIPTLNDIIDETDGEDEYIYDLCYCGTRLRNEMRVQSPPVNIHEILSPWQLLQDGGDFPHAKYSSMVSDFSYNFTNVHTITHMSPWAIADWYDSIILWPYDAMLQDFSIVRINSMFYEHGLEVTILETLFAIDELHPTDAIIFNVSTDFIQHRYPSAAIIFTSEAGVQYLLFIVFGIGDVYCIPRYHLLEIHNHIVVQDIPVAAFFDVLNNALPFMYFSYSHVQ